LSGPPTLTWPTPAAITYGTLLDTTQLDATANVPGAFVYNPPAGTKLSAWLGQTLTVTFTPNDTVNYTPATASVSIDVNPKPLTVTGITANDKVYDHTEAATANTGAAALSGLMSGDALTLSAIPTRFYTGLDGARALAFDAGGDLFVANYNAGTVSKFAPGSTTPTATLTGVTDPTAMVVGPDGTLYVANGDRNVATGRGTVSEFAPNSLVPTATLTGFTYPNALAIDRAGNLYVADGEYVGDGRSVKKFAPGSTTPSAYLTGLDNADAVAVDAAGNLFASDSVGVVKFAPGSTSASAPFSGLQYPIGDMAVDGAGNLCVADGAGVVKFAPGSTSPSATLMGPNTTNALSLAFDRAGDLYVGSNDSIFNFAPGAVTPSAIFMGIAGPPMALDANGNLFVVDNGSSVIRYSVNSPATAVPASMPALLPQDVGWQTSAVVLGLKVTGGNLADYQLFPPTPPAQVKPAPLTVTGITAANKPFDGTTAATINTSGATLTGVLGGDQVAFGLSPSAILPTSQFATTSNNYLIATDAAGNVYVGNTRDHDNLVRKFAPGATAPSFVLTGLSAPVEAMAVDGAGNVFVVSGTSVDVFAAGSTAPTATLAVSASNLVADAQGDVYAGGLGTVYQFKPGSTTPSATITAGGSLLAVDGAGDLYVAAPTGSSVTKFAPGSTTPTATLTGINSPVAMAAGADGTLFVANADGTVSEFAPGAASPDLTIPVPLGPTEKIASLVVDSGGDLYVGIDGDVEGYGGTKRVIAFARGSSSPRAFLSGMYRASQMAFDPAGNLYVGDNSQPYVLQFTKPATLGATGAFASRSVGNNVAVTVSGLGTGGSENYNYTIIDPTTTANITPALPATHFQVTAVPAATSGLPASFTVIALDRNNNPTGRYTGTVHFTSSDGSAVLPDGARLTLGRGVFNATFNTRGFQTISADDSVDPTIAGTSTAVAVSPAAVRFAVSAPTVATVHNAFVVTVTAQDSSGHTALGYTGTVQITSTDTQAALPPAATLVNGVGTFPVTLWSAGGPWTVTATDTQDANITGTSGNITVNPGPTAGFAVTAPTEVTSRVPFNFTVTAVDEYGNPTSNYQGTVHFTSTDSAAVLPADATISNGSAVFTATLYSYDAQQTIQVTDSAMAAITGSNNSIYVLPSPGYFTVSVPTGSVIAGVPFNITVTYYPGDLNYQPFHFLTSTDPTAVFAPGISTDSVILNTPGSQTITATDNRGLGISGTSSPILVRGFQVDSLTATPTGFVATFNKPFDPSKLTLYGFGQQNGQPTAQDVTLVGDNTGPISGSLIIDPSNSSLTFKATTNGLALDNNFNGYLPDDTYTVTLVSGSSSNGFLDAGRHALGGQPANGPPANYTTTFTTIYQAAATPILGIPDFARGPDDAHPVQVPNDTGHGIPITLYNAAQVTDVTFTLKYNPALLNVTGAASGDATDPSSQFTLVGAPTIIDATHATADFHYQSATPQSGKVVLGDIRATVPNSAAAMYKAKELLQLVNIVINHGAVTGAVGADGLHVNAYSGDLSGNGSIDALDVALASFLARGSLTGLAAYPLVDPAIVGDVAQDYSVDAGDVSDLAAYTAQLPTPMIPAIPTGLVITPAGADPALRMSSERRGARGEHAGNSPAPPHGPGRFRPHRSR
jgi:ligand-binding sensor domain-containing protein